MLRFGHEIRWCFAVADARIDVVFCRCGCVRKPCSSCLSFSILVGFVFLNFSRVSEVTLDPFVGFLCYVLGTKRRCFAVADARNDVDVLPLRMRQKAIGYVARACLSQLCVCVLAVADASESYAARACLSQF